MDNHLQSSGRQPSGEVLKSRFSYLSCVKKEVPCFYPTGKITAFPGVQASGRLIQGNLVNCRAEGVYKGKAMEAFVCKLMSSKSLYRRTAKENLNNSGRKKVAIVNPALQEEVEFVEIG